MTEWDPPVGSYQSRVVIEGTAGEAGVPYVDFWSNAILSDLFGLLNEVRITNLDDSVRRTAHAAHTWYWDAWHSASRNERRFAIIQFGLYVYSEPGQRGALLAEIDVLTGDYETHGLAA